MSSQLELALAACRSIRFAANQAARHGGDYSLHDLVAAVQLACQALEAKPAAEMLATHQPLASQAPMHRPLRAKYEAQIRAAYPMPSGLILQWVASQGMFIAVLPKRAGSWSRGSVSCTIRADEAVKLELFIAEKTAPIIKALARTAKKGGRK